MQYDLLIKNGYVVDYASAREGYLMSLCRTV